MFSSFGSIVIVSALYKEGSLYDANLNGLICTIKYLNECSYLYKKIIIYN